MRGGYKLKLDKKLSPLVQRRTITKIEAELSKMLEPILSNEDMKIAQNIISEVAFTKVALHNLKVDIIEIGSVYEFVNGTQKMLRENPSQKTYNTLLTKYTGSLDALLKLIPREQNNSANNIINPLDVFLEGVMTH